MSPLKLILSQWSLKCSEIRIHLALNFYPTIQNKNTIVRCDLDQCAASLTQQTDCHGWNNTSMQTPTMHCFVCGRIRAGTVSAASLSRLSPRPFQHLLHRGAAVCAEPLCHEAMQFVVHIMRLKNCDLRLCDWMLLTVGYHGNLSFCDKQESLSTLAKNNGKTGGKSTVKNAGSLLVNTFQYVVSK